MTDCKETVVTIQEEPIIVNQEKPIVANEEKFIVANQETPFVANLEQPIVANEEKPFIANQEKPIVAQDVSMEQEATLEQVLTAASGGGSGRPLQVLAKGGRSVPAIIFSIILGLIVPGK
jgi:hypothetical protein